MPMFPLHHDDNSNCLHCVISKKINEYMESSEGKQDIAEMRQASELDWSDDDLWALNIMLSLAPIMGHLGTMMEPVNAVSAGLSYRSALSDAMKVARAVKHVDNMLKGKG